MLHYHMRYMILLYRVHALHLLLHFIVRKSGTFNLDDMGGLHINASRCFYQAP